MNNSKDRSRILGQLQSEQFEDQIKKAGGIIQQANDLNYDWVELIDHLVHVNPIELVRNLRFIYFECIDLYLRDDGYCGKNDSLADALYDLRKMADALEKMRDSEVHSLSFTMHPDICCEQTDRAAGSR